MGVEMMGVMTTQQPLPLAPAGAVLIGDAAALVEDGDGGRVFIRGELTFVWDAGDDLDRGRRRGGASLRAIAAAVGVSTNSVRRALPQPTPEPAAPTQESQPKAEVLVLPVLPDPADRSGERAAARWGQLSAAPPVFAPAGRVPLAGLLLAMP